MNVTGLMLCNMEDNSDERKLVEAILSGERAAFERLIYRYERLVLHIVTPIAGSGPDRDDICQDIFLKVYSSLPSFQFKSKLSTWIGRIAYNNTINHVIRKRNVPMSRLLGDDSEVTFDIPDSASNKEEELIHQENLNHLAAALTKLPPIQNTIILLFHSDEYSLNEISAMLNLSVGAVKTHLFRGRKNLKELVLSQMSNYGKT